MKIKVRVKTWEEIKKTADYDGDSDNFELQMYFLDGNYADTFITPMKKYCGKIIELNHWWDGKEGRYGGYGWTLPMLSEIDVKEHNRNGANE